MKGENYEKKNAINSDVGLLTVCNLCNTGFGVYIQL